MPESITTTATTTTATTTPAAPASTPAAPPSDPWTAIDAKIEARAKPDATPADDATPEPDADAPEGGDNSAPPTPDAKPDDRALLDSLDDLKDEPEKKPDEKKDEEPPKPEPKKEEKPADKLERQAPKELREALKKANTEVKAKSDQVAALEAKIKEYESRGQDTTTLTERLAAREKELESMRGELSLLKFEASDDWKRQYEQPFNMAANMAQQDVMQLQVADADGNARQATWEDFVALWNMPKGKAFEKAADMFGPAAQLVTQHLTELKRLDFMGQQAKEAERKGWAERVKSEQARQVQEREALQAMWARVNDDLTKRVKDYADAPDDTEASGLRQEGYALYDAEPRSVQERVVKDAHVRHRVAAFGVLKLQNARLTDKVAALEKELAQFKASKPTLATKRQGEPPPKKAGASIWEDFPTME